MATLSAVCLLVIGATAADAAPPTTQQVQAALRLGLRNLTSEGRAWIEDRKCASCHHVPMMVWALAEAQRRGEKIDDSALATALDFALADDNRGKVLPEACRAGEPPKPLNLAAVFLASGMRSLAKLDSARASGLERLRDHLRKTQWADGSWTVPEGRLPILGDGESTTLLAALALSDGDSQHVTRNNPPDADRAKAVATAKMARRPTTRGQPAANRPAAADNGAA